MRNIGFMIVGGEVGIAFASVLARHGAVYSQGDTVKHLACAFVVWTVLTFTKEVR